MVRRLIGQGLRDDPPKPAPAVRPGLLEPSELIVLAHLSREAIDDAVTARRLPAAEEDGPDGELVVHGVDPRLQDRARACLKQLGDRSSRPGNRPRPGSSSWAPLPSPAGRRPQIKMSRSSSAPNGAAQAREGRAVSASAIRHQHDRTAYREPGNGSRRPDQRTRVDGRCAGTGRRAGGGTCTGSISSRLPRPRSAGWR